MGEWLPPSRCDNRANTGSRRLNTKERNSRWYARGIREVYRDGLADDRRVAPRMLVVVQDVAGKPRR